MDHMYKSQLQSYTMKQSMELPIYAADRQGPPHAPLFRCKVTVCGQTFQSQEFCPKLKAAEHAAAKLALASLTPLNPEGVVVDVAYKNLLQEIAQKENFLLPVYATSTSGLSHAPTFTSTVEFAGNFYKGEEAKNKKLAEMNAAKVAFMCIKYDEGEAKEVDKKKKKKKRKTEETDEEEEGEKSKKKKKSKAVEEEEDGEKSKKKKKEKRKTEETDEEEEGETSKKKKKNKAVEEAMTKDKGYSKKKKKKKTR